MFGASSELASVMEFGFKRLTAEIGATMSWHDELMATCRAEPLATDRVGCRHRWTTDGAKWADGFEEGSSLSITNGTWVKENCNKRKFVGNYLQHVGRRKLEYGVNVGNWQASCLTDPPTIANWSINQSISQTINLSLTWLARWSRSTKLLYAGPG